MRNYINQSVNILTNVIRLAYHSDGPLHDGGLSNICFIYSSVLLQQLCLYLPVQRGLLDEHVHGVEQQVGLGPEGSQRVNHDALDQTRLLQRLHQGHKLPGEPERHELRDGEELRGQEAETQIYIVMCGGRGHQ